MGAVLARVCMSAMPTGACRWVQVPTRVGIVYSGGSCRYDWLVIRGAWFRWAGVGDSVGRVEDFP